jgi:addiction module HigA family antidote
MERWREGAKARRSEREKENMSIKNESQAGWTVHPGEILREEFLEPMNISAYRLAMELHVSPPTVNDIVREKRGITPEMAARLARYFGTSEQFWLNLQDTFAVHHVKEKYSKELKAIKPVAAAAAVR